MTTVNYTEALLQTSADIQNLAHELIAHQRRSLAPAAVETIVLTVSEPVWSSDVGEGMEALSIGLLNPNSIEVYLGIGGNSASARGRSPSAPPKSLLVLPIDVRDLEVGANVADLTSDAVVFLLRFPTVQPAFLGTAP